MSGRGRRAVLPPADHRADPALAPDGLVVTVFNKAGHDREFDFAALPVAGSMQRSLAVVFAAQSRLWNSHSTAENYWAKLRIFARFLSGMDQPPQDVDDLTAAMLKRWRAQHIATNTGRITLSAVRALLRRDPRLGHGPVAEELARRVPKPTPSKQSYEEPDRARVVLAAQRQFRAALLRIRENSELLERWRSGHLPEESPEWRLGQVLDHLTRTGDVPRSVRPNSRGGVKNRRLLGRTTGVELLWGRLFLTRMELTALAVLLTDRFGWNLSAYHRMPTPTRAPSVGETTTVTYQVQVEKRRAGVGRWFSTENITDSGADSPGRLITQALEATSHGRTLAARLAPGHDLLMTARTQRVGVEEKDLDRPRPVGPLVFGVSITDARRWAVSHQLGGSPFQRARRTTVTREGRPLQHSRGTHESVYVLPDQRVQRAAQNVIAGGAEEALQQARNTVFGGHVRQAPDPRHLETATADCADEESSPWPAPGGGCGADFLLCLACPNAHVHPGHHARLAHLHQRILSLRSALPDHAWNEHWGDHLLRLEDLRSKVGPHVWNSALSQVSDADHALVDLLLEGSLAP
ncbi:hypothetical protein [Streptomyces sp. CL7]|uniref:hypothetical protein n=1 Tax=Streptomyces sp. CL7 TaxID=3096006 RepID=UPI002A75B906|nr:hypothetical protein [Streptomyces sp. CL7]WPP32284.1 hypothetical protein SJH97_24475 [Streptomyces sp. CL7]